MAATGFFLHWQLMDSSPLLPRWARGALVLLIGLVIVGYGAVLVYATFINRAPEALGVEDLATAVGEGATSETPEGREGLWRVTTDSTVGYRVDEVLFGVSTQGVGRSNQITGHLRLEGTAVTEATFSVDMATVTSDDSRRDGQFRGRIMRVSQYPTAEFRLTAPIELGELPDVDTPITAEATGELTLRGVTQTVTFTVTAQQSLTRIGILGEIPILFDDYGIVNPSISGISVGEGGLLEFVLVAER